jgi:VanZ family protein
VGVVYAVLLAALSLARADALPEIPVLNHVSDKLMHFGLYAGYGFVLCWAWPVLPQGLRAGAMVVLFCTLYGALLEWLQGGLRALDRSFSPADMAANLSGALAGVGVWLPLARRAR